MTTLRLRDGTYRHRGNNAWTFNGLKLYVPSLSWADWQDICTKGAHLRYCDPVAVIGSLGDRAVRYGLSAALLEYLRWCEGVA
jgi:hypothetical protein